MVGKIEGIFLERRGKGKGFGSVKQLEGGLSKTILKL